MSPLVERVTNSFPHVQRTVASTYSGWIAVFMVPTSVGLKRRASRGRSADDAQDVIVLVGLVHRGARVDHDGDLLAGRAGRPRDDHVALAPGGQPVHRDR